MFLLVADQLHRLVHTASRHALLLVVFCCCDTSDGRHCVALNQHAVLLQLVWILGPVALIVATSVTIAALFWMDFIPLLSNEQMHRLKVNTRSE